MRLKNKKSRGKDGRKEKDSLRFVARGVTRPGGNRIGRTRMGIEGGRERPDRAELLGVVSVGEGIGRE